jgi:hypothetical protein
MNVSDVPVESFILVFSYSCARYLYEFLYGWLISAYNRADSFLTEHQSMAEYLKSKGKAANATNKKGGQSGNGKNKKKKERSATARPYAKEIAYCQAVQSMCGGYYKVKDGQLTVHRPRFFLFAQHCKSTRMPYKE